jgi:hypothetical protein
MNWLDFLPFVLWWLLIMAMATAAVFLIGLAIIRLVIEREEADK